MSIKVVIIDEHTLFREGLKALLAHHGDLQVVGEAGDARIAYDLVEAAEPDVVLMAIELAGIDGIAATREILRGVPRTRVLMVSRHEKEAGVFRVELLTGAVSNCFLHIGKEGEKVTEDFVVCTPPAK